MTWRKAVPAILIVLMLAVALLWLARARIAAQFATAYFRSHGVTSSVEVGDLGLSGVSGRFALGPSDAPDISADRIELHFDPLTWIPRVVEVRLVNPVIRARIDEQGAVTLPSLQSWIASLQQQQGKSRFVSDDLAVSLTGLRAMLATPGGALELDGDVRLVKNLPVRVSLTARPATIFYRGTAITLTAASMNYDPSRAGLTAAFSARRGDASAQAVKIALDIARPQWSAKEATAPSLHLRLSADGLTADAALRAPLLDITARNVVLNGSDATADVGMTGSLGYDPGSLVALRAQDRAMADAVIANLARLQLSWAGKITRHGARTDVASTAPLLVQGARGTTLRANLPTVSVTSDTVTASMDMALSGGGVPAAKLGLHDMLWRGGEFSATAALSTRFDFGSLRAADLSAAGPVSWRAGRFSFAPTACARATLAAFRTASDLARTVRAAICPTGQPLFVADAKGWSLHAQVRDAAAMLTLPNAQISGGAAVMNFAGQGSAIHGAVTVTAAQAADLAPAARYHPLQGKGAITLEDGVWHGRITVVDDRKNALGETTFVHVMASGAGNAHISTPKIVFAPDGLQPEKLSPLLAALRRAEGSARFQGDMAWTRQMITSSGALTIDSMDLMTPLGKAHAVKTDIRLVSLLPPVTAPDQQIAISRIDWTLPFSAIDLRFGFGDGAVRIGKLDLDFAEGHAALGAFTLNLSDPRNIAGTIQLKSIALDALINASNLGSKVKMEGRISGSVPFTLTAEGFRIRDGHVAADGAGHLSFDRTLWTQAGPAANAVQDFAYQALEHLGFDTLSADLNSVAGGRLQVVFKIRGKSDPPTPQTANVAVADILNGTALYKPIALPSGTPIDLTLDTSLNFDELLKSYAEAWSKSLDPGVSP